ncbi:hypothetical protein F4821DRAFT_122120 [Hypoxylon rubiginosum]|uniref:Uncharacterized protein n=1 Tax=Hypoxylon rubiginosum TaxID=110542 RepID=A0ACC0D2D5_9PEZI|nr:hypothetical protein F4821DRAFT_122120 [Hypoxylon rubiginosum]
MRWSLVPLTAVALAQHILLWAFNIYLQGEPLRSSLAGLFPPRPTVVALTLSSSALLAEFIYHTLFLLPCPCRYLAYQLLT